MCYPVCRMMYIKYPLLPLRKIVHEVAAVSILFCYLNGPLQNVRDHISVYKMCRVHHEIKPSVFYLLQEAIKRGFTSVAAN